MTYRIGLDVGGTHTDAVLMRERTVIGWAKTKTSEDVEHGIVGALRAALESSPVSVSEISAVMIGTTHFTNALVEKKRLTPVAAVRASLPANTAIPVGAGWPDAMLDAVSLKPFLIHGGAEFNGNRISAIRRDEVERTAEQIVAASIPALAISSPFSPLSPETETELAGLFLEFAPHLDVSLSHETGRLGIIERENANILNASLFGLARRTFAGFSRALHASGITAPLYISQNDGTVMDVEYATRFPVRTLASGPTNSMRGAAFLTGVENAVVIDVGGTTADAGALVNGFPREAAAELSIEGIRTNFRMPDVTSIGLGGGSIVRDGDGTVTIGPDSVGYEIATRALVFGGSELTATDVAVGSGLAEVGDPSLVADMEPHLAESALAGWHAAIDDLIRIVRGTPAKLPVVLVGGGSIIIDPERITEADGCVAPEYFQVANAIGASIPQVSGESDRVVRIGGDRDAAVAGCRQEAIAAAIDAGADPATVVVVDEDVVTLNLLEESAARVRIRAVGMLPLGMPPLDDYLPVGARLDTK